MRGTYPKLCPAVQYYRTGRRYFGCLKNTQSAEITFVPEYYEKTHESSLQEQKRFYKELAEQPVTSASAPLEEQTALPEPLPTDERVQKTEKEKQRVEEVSATQHRSRYYDAIRAQVQEKESEREAMHRLKKADGSFRMVQLKQQEEEVRQARLQKLQQSEEYCRSLSLQTQLKSALEEPAADSSQFSPTVKTNASLPRNKNHLAVDLAREFREPQYTNKHPKPVKCDPITFSHLPSVGEARKAESVPRHMSEYGLMMLQSRSNLNANLLVEPRYSKGQGLGYKDTRRLLV